MPIDKLLLTAEEAAESLGVGRSTVYDLMRLGRLSSVKIGRARRIPVAALHRFAGQLAAEDQA
ncbi:helix-turn-helix domain-containing protein [Plantibacter sp. VKM Ac-2880]|jgi:excisionase family DNA binding protein|uniref:helix-turn-helix domain-containing protein n=1 Tax=Plantibacter sp. VKM Ac-2880 TaxID=2783827 RepID=UPI001E344082|nr:helix-turn-helix domain-containing protein [Plantibacter sp. VKM Ac-2880]